MSLAFCDATKSCLMPSLGSRYLRHSKFVWKGWVYKINGTLPSMGKNFNYLRSLGVINNIKYKSIYVSKNNFKIRSVKLLKCEVLKWIRQNRNIV